MQFSCWKCGEVIELPPAGRVLSRDTCPKCDYDLRACRNCRFRDPAKHNQCAETQAEWVRDKEASNYCDYFSPNPVMGAGGSGSRTVSPSEDAKKGIRSVV